MAFGICSLEDISIGICYGNSIAFAFRSLDLSLSVQLIGRYSHP